MALEYRLGQRFSIYLNQFSPPPPTHCTITSLQKRRLTGWPHVHAKNKFKEMNMPCWYLWNQVFSDLHMQFFDKLNRVKSSQIKFTGLSNSTCAPTTIYLRTISGIGSSKFRENGASVGIQAILENGHCRRFGDVWRQSISRSGRAYSKSRFPPGKTKLWLTDLEVMPLEVTCCWWFKDRLRR